MNNNIKDSMTAKMVCDTPLVNDAGCIHFMLVLKRNEMFINLDNSKMCQALSGLPWSLLDGICSFVKVVMGGVAYAAAIIRQATGQMELLVNDRGLICAPKGFRNMRIYK